jgi:hypothetical protein
MPISGSASYGTTGQEFLDHWQSADAALGAAGPIVLPGKPLGWPNDVNSSVLGGLLADWDAKVLAIQSAVNGLELGRGELVILQGEMLDLLGQFTDKVRGLLSGTKWINAVPLQPSIGDAQSRFCAPLDDAEDLWERINTEQALGVGKVLVLQDRTLNPPVPLPLATFATRLATMKARWRGNSRLELDLKLARGERDAIQARMYPIMLNYRLVLPANFGPGTPIGDSLPRLTPEKGSTPDAAVLAGVWDAAKVKAVATASIPVQVGLKKARLLYSPGASWDADSASTVQTVSLVGVNLANPLVFETDFALSAPGSHALFRVEIENETGNVAQSNIVDVVRP